MGRLGSCALCGDEIHETDLNGIGRQMIGWELPRSKIRGKRQGGLNELKIATPTGAVAHRHCIEEAQRRHKRGIPIQQGGLF